MLKKSHEFLERYGDYIVRDATEVSYKFQKKLEKVHDTGPKEAVVLLIEGYRNALRYVHLKEQQSIEMIEQVRDPFRYLRHCHNNEDIFIKSLTEEELKEIYHVALGQTPIDSVSRRSYIDPPDKEWLDLNQLLSLRYVEYKILRKYAYSDEAIKFLNAKSWEITPELIFNKSKEGF